MSSDPVSAQEVAGQDVSEGVWIVTSSLETAELIDGALRCEEGLGAEGVCRDLRELSVRLEEAPIDLVIVDLVDDVDGMMGDLRVLVDDFPRVRFVVVTPVFDQGQMMEAMQAGVRHYIAHPTLDRDLGPTCKRLLKRGGGRGRGLGISVLSAGGGCGATTAAVNLAQELRLITEQTSLIVDMDTRYGGVAGYLGLNSRYGVADILERGESLDADLIRSTAAHKGNDIDVLLSPASIDFESPSALRLDNLDTVIRICRDAYPTIVVDAPMLTMDAAAELAEASSVTLIMFQLTVKDVRVTKAILDALARRGIGEGRVIPVANRRSKRSKTLTLREAQEALGEVSIRSLADDFVNALRGVNFGEPLATASPKCPLRKDIRALAEHIMEKHAPIRLKMTPANGKAKGIKKR